MGTSVKISMIENRKKWQKGELREIFSTALMSS